MDGSRTHNLFITTPMPFTKPTNNEIYVMKMMMLMVTIFLYFCIFYLYFYICNTTFEVLMCNNQGGGE